MYHHIVFELSTRRVGECKAAVWLQRFFLCVVNELILDLLGPMVSFLVLTPSRDSSASFYETY
jgi:hypothetical protein